jgi:8-amino-7-oxononanoate synthase
VVSWQSALDADLQQRADHALYRRRRVVHGAQGVHVDVDGKRCINFCSNDYLGLASHPAVVAAFQQAASRYGVGSGASHLVCGHGHEHHELERELATFTGRERALLFSSGYLANLGAVSALFAKGDQLYQDKLNHASLLDAAALCGARLRRFKHNDTAHLASRLASAPDARRRLLVVDGVFSMDGDMAPLPQLVGLAAEHDALLMVDDAHGLGVLGDNGAGSLSHFGLSGADVPLLMGTLGKAFGTFGAFVAGSDTLIETLIQRARTYIYTTALPPAVAAATRASLQLVQRETWRRDHLHALIARLQAGLQAAPWTLLPSLTPIQPLLVGASGDAIALSDKLWEEGLWVSPIRPPTVPAGTARLRITLSAAHSARDVDKLIAALVLAD